MVILSGVRLFLLLLTLLSPESLQLTLFRTKQGHILYPAAIAMSRFLELHSQTLLRSKDSKGKGKAVIELGAGGGLPGLVAALEGAEQVRPDLSGFAARRWGKED